MHRHGMLYRGVELKEELYKELLQDLLKTWSGSVVSTGLLRKEVGGSRGRVRNIPVSMLIAEDVKKRGDEECWECRYI